jgi:hypothetical protein
LWLISDYHAEDGWVYIQDLTRFTQDNGFFNSGLYDKHSNERKRYGKGQRQPYNANNRHPFLTGMPWDFQCTAKTIYDTVALDDRTGKGRFQLMRMIGDTVPIMIRASYGHGESHLSRVKNSVMSATLVPVTLRNMPDYLLHQTDSARKAYCIRTHMWRTYRQTPDVLHGFRSPWH